MYNSEHVIQDQPLPVELVVEHGVRAGRDQTLSSRLVFVGEVFQTWEAVPLCSRCALVNIFVGEVVECLLYILFNLVLMLLERLQDLRAKLEEVCNSCGC